jgi:RimJ/RimL family protein N-acetyltransferase
MANDFQIISTERLDLHCLNEDELFAMGSDPEMFRNRTFLNPYDVISGEELPRENRVADVRGNPENIRWYFRAIVDRSRNLVVGGTSFHAGPDERGMVEIGLGIHELEQGKGFATEAVRGMWLWATSQPGVKFLRYTVDPNNAPSIKVISKLGVPQVGEQIDEVDGLEYVFETSVEGFLARLGSSPT